MRWLLLIGSILFFACQAQAQLITQGPAIGAVTYKGARMYLRTEDSHILKVQLSTDSTFSDQPLEFIGQTRTELDNSVIIDIGYLRPDTRYYYRLLVDDQLDTLDGNFRTFPSPGTQGDFTFVTGSCQETENMKVFDVIPKHNPYFLLHTGDYTYPDYQIDYGYSADYDLMALSYRKRYDEKVMKGMLRYIPIDYIYDDNDFVGMSGGRYYKNGERKNSKIFWGHNEFDTRPYPAFWRRNCIKGYVDFFPGYRPADTATAIHHSFKFGNCEFFFLDRCSAKPHPSEYAYRYQEKRDRFLFDPPEDHVLFGKEQMDWLKKGLKKSKADWKFIVSGVPLNPKLVQLIYTGIKIQKVGWEDNNGFRMASGFSSYWAGHPHELYDFYQWMEEEGMQDIIVISGDTHHNVMDDGEGKYLPEMNASGLSVTETYLAWYLNIIGRGIGGFKIKDIWNQGGNGIGNKNFKNAFGKVQVVNDEHVELTLIDEDNEVISSFKVYHSSQNISTKQARKLNNRE